MATTAVKPTSSERQALLHADPATGRITASGCHLRDELRRKGYAQSENKELVLTDYGWRVRARLLEEHREFHVSGVPWAKIVEITDLYLENGLSVEEISHRTRVTGEGVIAALVFRKVLPGS